MSYEKAMRHSRNVRKQRKQANMYFGFDTGARGVKSAYACPISECLMNISYWFKSRHSGDKAKSRQSIREEIAIYRSLLDENDDQRRPA